MGKRKFYAVFDRSTLKRKIFETWDEAKEHILHKNVAQKSFPSLESANFFLDQVSGKTEENQPETTAPSSDAPKEAGRKEAVPTISGVPRKDLKRNPTKLNDTQMIIYTDGSDKKGTNKLGAGAAVFWQGKEYHWAVSADFCAENFAKGASNPTVEMYAVSAVLNLLYGVFGAKGKKFPAEIVVYSDYNGVQHYAKGAWKPKLGKTKVPWFHKEAYAMVCAIQKMRGVCKMTFKHVKGHSGVYGNDQADDLADCNAMIDEISKMFD